MSLYNININSFKAMIRLSHLTKREEDKETFENVYCFGIQSASGKILTFHVMTDKGMLRSRVPLSEIYFKKPENDIPFHFKQLWDCFSNNVTVTTFDFLEFHRCQVVLKDGLKIWGTYMFTVDWFDNPYSDEPSDYKCGHIIKADDGYLLCQPNNRIFWKDSNWVTKPIPEDLKIYKVDNILSSVENQSDRWVSEDSNNFYYEMKKDVR